MSSSWQAELEGGGRKRQTDRGKLTVINTLWFIFLLQIIYSSEEWLFAFMIFYSGLTRHTALQPGRENRRTINVFHQLLIF